MTPAKAFKATSTLNGRTAEVVLEGILTIHNAAMIRDSLLPLLDGPENIIVVLKNIVKIDLTALQLMAALKKSANEKGINVSFKSSFNEPVLSMLDNTGLSIIFAKN